MSRVTYRPLAEADLVDVWVEIALDSPERADSYVDTLQRRFEALAEFPNMGHRAEEVTETGGMRVFPFDAYLVFYSATEEGIEIARVWHARRDINALFFDEG